MTDLRARTRAKRRAALGVAVFAATLIPLRRRAVGPRSKRCSEPSTSFPTGCTFPPGS